MLLLPVMPLHSLSAALGLHNTGANTTITFTTVKCIRRFYNFLTAYCTICMHTQNKVWSMCEHGQYTYCTYSSLTKVYITNVDTILDNTNNQFTP